MYSLVLERALLRLRFSTYQLEMTLWSSTSMEGVKVRACAMYFLRNSSLTSRESVAGEQLF